MSFILQSIFYGVDLAFLIINDQISSSIISVMRSWPYLKSYQQLTNSRFSLSYELIKAVLPSTHSQDILRGKKPSWKQSVVYRPRKAQLAQLLDVICPVSICCLCVCVCVVTYQFRRCTPFVASIVAVVCLTLTQPNALQAGF